MKAFIYVLVLVGASLAEVPELQFFNENNNVFTEKLTTEVIKQNKARSVVLSAFSVLQPLAEMGLASEGESHDELLRVVGSTDDNLIEAVYPSVNKLISSIKGVELKLANKIYIETSEKLNETLAAISAELFGPELQNIDFSKNEAAAQEMNNWVENKTNHRIKDLVDPKSLTQETRAVLVNAVYFKGNWINKFTEKQTKPRDFFVTKDNTIRVPTMHFRNQLKYAFSKKLNAEVLELPYEGEESSLLIVVPKELDGLPALLTSLNEDPSHLHQVSLERSDIDLYLPKFKIETTTNLKEALRNIGITKLFEATEGNLKNVLLSDQPLHISEAIQKAFIEVNEAGTEAAVANEFIVYGSAPMFHGLVPIQVRADRPFYFQVKAKNIVLFNGIVQF